MSKQSQRVINWRKRTKRKIVDAMGGCCQVCFYNRCNDALEFHHINPKEKEFTMGSLKATPKKLETIRDEVRKCILLCSNCHKEFHAGIISLPEKYATLNEEILVGEYELRRRMKQQTATSIPIDRRKIFLTNKQLIDMLNTQFNGNKSALARSLRVSETAIRKKLKQ